MTLSKLIPLAVIIGFCSFLVTCSEEKDSPTGPDLNPGNPVLISVSPSSGLPGTALAISGFHIDPANISDYAAFLDREAAPIRISGDSLVQVAIPLFLDSVLGWPNPPTDSVSLELLLDGKVVAHTGKIILVDSLPHATGTTEQIQVILDTLVTDLQLFFGSLPTPNSWEQEYRDSLMSVIRSFVSGPDISLAAILKGNSSLLNGMEVDPELADALMASTGVLEYWQEYAKVFASSSGRLKENIAGLQSLGILCPDLGPDADLACQMQLYVLVHAWHTEFIAATRLEWEYSIGWVIDAIALVPGAAALPPVEVAKLIGAMLTITDVVVGNVVLSLLPSHITSFDMILASDTMNVDEFTNSQIFIMAANSPERMTLNEMVDLVLTVVGFKASTVNPEIQKIVLDVVQFIIDKLRMVYSILHSLAPEVFGDPELVDRTWYAFPNMTWGPVEVTNNDLVELFSFEPGVLEPDSAVFEWWGAGCGKASIQARTRGAGERSKLVRDWLFCALCTYSGGAFGEDAAATPSKHVTVGQPGEMDIIITGLPEADSADVWVYFPDGAFEYIGDSKNLTELESGEYRVQANEVESSDGTVYVSEPESRTVDVTCDSTVTVEISYKPKFGNIYLVLVGLYEINNDSIYVRVEGPGDFLRELDRTTLIDSLEPGLYDIFASEVDDGWGQTWVPDPSYSEITVERNNTTTLTITYKEKFGAINVQAAFLPSGLEADIDVNGPDGFFHHSTGSEKIDSLIPGEYRVEAYDIIDNEGDTIKPSPTTHIITVTGGDEFQARFDYSGGHELTVNIAGLPEFAAADISIAGPDGYSNSVVGDTVLKVPAGGPYLITANDVVYDAREYKAKPADTTVTMNVARTVTFNYKTRAIMSLYLGGMHGQDEDDWAQRFIRAYVSSQSQDSTITKDEWAPERGVLPEQLVLDTCGFEDGRLRLDGVSNYRIEAVNQYSTADFDLTFDVQDTFAVVTYEGNLSIYTPDAGGSSSPYRTDAFFELYFNEMFTIEIFNPNAAEETFAGVSMTNMIEVMNPNARISGNFDWILKSHNCGFDKTFFIVKDDYISHADTVQPWGSFTGGSVNGLNSREMEFDYRLRFGGLTISGEPTAEANVKGRIEFILRQD